MRVYCFRDPTFGRRHQHERDETFLRSNMFPQLSAFTELSFRRLDISIKYICIHKYVCTSNVIPPGRRAVGHVSFSRDWSFFFRFFFLSFHFVLLPRFSRHFVTSSEEYLGPLDSWKKKTKFLSILEKKTKVLVIFEMFLDGDFWIFFFFWRKFENFLYENREVTNRLLYKIVRKKWVWSL